MGKGLTIWEFGFGIWDFFLSETLRLIEFPTL